MIIKLILPHTFPSYFPVMVLLSFHNRHHLAGLCFIDLICTPMSSQSSSCELSDTLLDLILQDFKLKAWSDEFKQKKCFAVHMEEDK